MRREDLEIERGYGDRPKAEETRMRREDLEIMKDEKYI